MYVLKIHQSLLHVNYWGGVREYTVMQAYGSLALVVSLKAGEMVPVGCSVSYIITSTF